MQLAILRFENLSADPSLDWMGRGFSEIISGSLDGSQQLYAIPWRSLHSFDAALGRRPAATPGISSERAAALAGGANRLVYGSYSVSHGMLQATATEEDLETRKTVRVVSAGAPLETGIFAVADSLARQLGATHSFSTGNMQSLRDYVAGLESADPAASMHGFAQAAADDPNFGRAYVYWLEVALEQRNRSQADRALGQARAHGARFSPLDRARLDLDASDISGDFAARQRALETLAQLDPENPNWHRALGETVLSTRNYEGAVAQFRRALSRRPDDAAALNFMGYAATYAGDLPTAIRVLRRYEQLRPAEPNPLDSLGDAHFALGHYVEAEQFYLAAARKAPAFLNGGEPMKAAQARLMAGDVPGATALFEQYLAERRRASDPMADYYAAVWSWQTGQRRVAIQQMSELARTNVSAGLQAAVWLLELGNRSAAREQVRDAGTRSPLAALVEFLTQPEGSSPNAVPESLRDYARAYAALFAKDFRKAVPIFEEIFHRPTRDPDDGLAVLLAWCYEQTGQWQSSEPLLRLNPLPSPAGLPLLGSLFFPRLFFLRGALLDHDGQHNQAVPNYRLFRALSDPEPDIWSPRLH